MTCGSAREYLFAFLDNELDAPLSIELQRHLDGCPTCAREAEIERTVRKQLRTAVDSDLGNVPVLENVQRGGGFAEHTGGGANAIPSAGIHTARAISRRWPLAAAAALTIAVGAWLAIGGGTEVDGGHGFVDLLVSDFEHFLDEGSRVQIASSDPDTIAAWLRERTTLAVILPMSPGQGTRLIGGRKCKIDGRPAAFTAYEVNGVPTSYVVAAGEHVSLDGMLEVRRDGSAYWVDHCRGYTVVACRRDKLVYAVVSKSGEAELVSLMMDAVHESN